MKGLFMNPPIRIIGIDPGLRRTGWGVIETLGNSLKFVAAGTVKSDEKLDLASRLCQLFDGLSAVIDAQMPHEAAVDPDRRAGAHARLRRCRDRGGRMGVANSTKPPRHALPGGFGGGYTEA